MLQKIGQCSRGITGDHNCLPLGVPLKLATFELGLSKTAFLTEGAEQERVLGTLEKQSGSLRPKKGEAGVRLDPDSDEEPWEPH